MSRSLYARLALRHGPRELILSRRALLKAALAGSAGLLLSGAPAFARPGSAGKRIVVVGAGFAGLACAYELKSAGYDVTVVEARNRLGGRVLSFSDLIDGKNVEGGGELIGSNHPTWVGYQERFNLDFLDVTEAEDAEFPIILDGRRLTLDESNGLWEEMDAALSLINTDALNVDADRPWTADGAAALDARSCKDWIDSLQVSGLCKLGLAVQFMADNGVDPIRQSYLGNLAQVSGGGVETYWTDSEVYRCHGGNQQLAKMLAESIGPDRIVLKLPVRAIALGKSGTPVRVECTDGRTLECDDVVLAVPPSTWKRIAFSPELPKAIRPQMGTNVKYLAVVKDRFWNEAGLAADSLTDGDISMTWEGTDNQPHIDGKSSQACLTCFSGGSAAERARARTGEGRTAAYHAELEKLYPGFAEQFESARFMDWPADQWTQAGYSFPAPGEVTTVSPLLRQGVVNAAGTGLHFAGEHTSTAFVGYMEGALHSGASLAKRLAQRDGLAK